MIWRGAHALRHCRMRYLHHIVQRERVADFLRDGVVVGKGIDNYQSLLVQVVICYRTDTLRWRRLS
jgi:hypothetical protein